jgi:hypothetical protein
LAKDCQVVCFALFKETFYARAGVKRDHRASNAYRFGKPREGLSPPRRWRKRMAGSLKGLARRYD